MVYHPACEDAAELIKSVEVDELKEYLISLHEAAALGDETASRLAKTLQAILDNEAVSEVDLLAFAFIFIQSVSDEEDDEEQNMEFN